MSTQIINDNLITSQISPLSSNSTENIASNNGRKNTDIAGIQETADSIKDGTGKVLKGSSIVVGFSAGKTPATAFGNFGLFPINGNEPSYFGSKTFAGTGPIPGIPGVGVGFALVGTANANKDEAGMGMSSIIPTPAGNLFLFANFRQNGATVGSSINAEIDKTRTSGKPFTVSVNFGACYSVSDGAALALWNAGIATGNPALTAAGMTIQGGAALTGGNAWLGIANRGTMTWENGKLKEITFGDLKIPANKIPEVLGGAVLKAQKDALVIKNNNGSPKVASFNDTLKLAYGASPWQILESSVDKKNGKALGHNGNPILKIAAPFHNLQLELNGKYQNSARAITPINSNKQAGIVADSLVARANDSGGKNEKLRVTALLMSPEHLNFGSKELKNAYALAAVNPTFLAEVNAIRKQAKVDPIYARPTQDDYVQDAFGGHLRSRDDMQRPANSPERMAPPTFPRGSDGGYGNPSL
jgi:hypothetical protein